MRGTVLEVQEYSLAFRLAFAGFVIIVLPGVWAYAQDRPDAVEAEVSIGADGRTVISDFATNTCGHPLRLDISETPSRVEVRTLVDRDWWLASCNDVALPRKLQERLSEPLGDRELVAVR